MFKVMVPPKSIPILKLSTRSKVILALSLAGVVVLMRQQIAGMDSWFFQPSLSGTQGLVLYLVGQDDRAARAYRAHFQNLVRSEWSTGDSLMDAILAGDPARAGRDTAQMLEADPEDRRAWLYTGVAALEEDNPARALDAFNRVLNRDPDDADALIYASIAQARTGAYGAAIDGLSRTLRNSRIGWGILSLLLVLQAAGELDQLSAEDKPWCLLAHYYRYLRIFDASNGGRAIAYAEQAVTAGDRLPDAYMTMSVVYTKRGRLKRALEAALKAIEVDPGYSMGYWQAAFIYGRRGDIENELLMSKAAFEADMADPFYVGSLSYVLMTKLGDAQQAAVLFERGVQANPDNWRAYYWLGTAYRFLGDETRAADRFRNAIALLSREDGIYRGDGYSRELEIDIYEQLASSLNELDQEEEAIATLQRAVTLAPGAPGPHISLAYLYAERHRYGDAVQEIDRAMRLGVYDTDVRSGLCALYHNALEFRAAVACFRSVLDRNPKDQRALRLLPESIQNLNLQLGQP